MKLALEKEEFFILSIMVPMSLGLILLLSSVKAPSEIFTIVEKKQKARIIRKVEVKQETKVEETKPAELPSLSQSLAAPAASLGGDLKSLSAGLVSEGNGGSGGMNIAQGESSAMELAQNSGGESRPARAVQVTNPIYPTSAQARGIEGYVIVEIVISDRGQVTEARVLSANPSGVFDQSAIEAVKKWSFQPGIENGKTIVSRIKQKVNFELN